MRSIQRVVAPPEPFDPATSTRVFRIAVPAFSTLLSAVFERVHAAAPSVSVEWLLPNLHAPPAVAEGQIDFGHVGGGSRLPDGVDVHVGQPFTWVTFVRKNHPSLSDWGADAWTAWPHVIVNLGNELENPTDEATGRLGVNRTIRRTDSRLFGCGAAPSRNQHARHFSSAHDGRRHAGLWFVRAEAAGVTAAIHVSVFLELAPRERPWQSMDSRHRPRGLYEASAKRRSHTLVCEFERAPVDATGSVSAPLTS